MNTARRTLSLGARSHAWSERCPQSEERRRPLDWRTTLPPLCSFARSPKTHKSPCGIPQGQVWICVAREPSHRPTGDASCPLAKRSWQGRNVERNDFCAGRTRHKTTSLGWNTDVIMCPSAGTHACSREMRKIAFVSASSPRKTPPPANHQAPQGTLPAFPLSFASRGDTDNFAWPVLPMRNSSLNCVANDACRYFFKHVSTLAIHFVASGPVTSVFRLTVVSTARRERLRSLNTFSIETSCPRRTRSKETIPWPTVARIPCL